MSQAIEKVAIYCRVSSEQQREQGTIKSQRATLEGYANRQGYWSTSPTANSTSVPWIN